LVKDSTQHYQNIITCKAHWPNKF